MTTTTTTSDGFTELSQYFGPVVKDLRIKAELSQRELGKRLGVSDGEISKIETGRIIPTLKLALRLLAQVGLKNLGTLQRLLELKQEADRLTN